LLQRGGRVLQLLQIITAKLINRWTTVPATADTRQAGFSLFSLFEHVWGSVVLGGKAEAEETSEEDKATAREAYPVPCHLALVVTVEAVARLQHLVRLPEEEGEGTNPCQHTASSPG